LSLLVKKKITALAREVIVNQEDIKKEGNYEFSTAAHLQIQDLTLHLQADQVLHLLQDLPTLLHQLVTLIVINLID